MWCPFNVLAYPSASRPLKSASKEGGCVLCVRVCVIKQKRCIMPWYRPEAVVILQEQHESISSVAGPAIRNLGLCLHGPYSSLLLATGHSTTLALMYSVQRSNEADLGTLCWAYQPTLPRRSRILGMIQYLLSLCDSHPCIVQRVRDIPIVRSHSGMERRGWLGATLEVFFSCATGNQAPKRFVVCDDTRADARLSLHSMTLPNRSNGRLSGTLVLAGASCMQSTHAGRSTFWSWRHTHKLQSSPSLLSHITSVNDTLLSDVPILLQHRYISQVATTGGEEINILITHSTYSTPRMS